MFQEWLKDYEKFKKNNNMSEKEIIKICRILCGKKNKKGKREYPLFASLQLQEDYSKDEIAEAIESLLDLYQAEKEKNKELEENLKIATAMLTKGTYPEAKEGDNDFSKQFIPKSKVKEIIYPTPENYIPLEVQQSDMYKKLKNLVED